MTGNIQEIAISPKLPIAFLYHNLSKVAHDDPEADFWMDPTHTRDGSRAYPKMTNWCGVRSSFTKREPSLAVRTGIVPVPPYKNRMLEPSACRTESTTGGTRRSSNALDAGQQGGLLRRPEFAWFRAELGRRPPYCVSDGKQALTGPLLCR